LTDEDYARKVEGYYFTGLPLFAYDPNFGFGGGARVYYYYDGHRSDPLFAYTPYLHRVYAQAFASTGGAQDHVIDYDAPAFPNSNYRVRATLEFEAATDWPYFGVGSRSMAPLSYPGAPGAVFQRMSDYDRATSARHADGTTYARYNVFEFHRPVLQLALERNMLGGRLRSMAGVNLSYMDLHDYTGEPTPTNENDPSGNALRAPEAMTLLASDCAAKLVAGCSGGWDNVLRLALSFDTRDFEPDPNSGVYAELSGEFGTRALASQYEYMRLMLSVRGFYSPIPRVADLVVAVRGLYEVQTKGTPFFSQTLLPFIDDNHSGLGGFRTLRGFRQNRFVGPVIALTNYEVRWTFMKFRALGQGIALIAVPFLDIGRVFDNVGQTTLAGWRRSQGVGLRVAWNAATIIMIDYGISEEDDGLYLNFNHIF
jgi:outer membrane protein assembly factor BamA